VSFIQVVDSLHFVEDVQLMVGCYNLDRFTFQLGIVYRDLLFNIFKSVVRVRLKVSLTLALTQP